ncbi:MAG TPA: multiheme c-type cytochrome [Opitutus sp.]|nr:multiheme c-type cytochrome [Opitutus sp.]
MPARYVGNEACRSCHADQFQSYADTAHARTSAWPTAQSIRGSFAPGADLLRTANPNLYFKMERNERGAVETAVLRTSETQVLTRTERIDFVVGSGRKGQTYLYWDGDRLCQLPVSYWTQGQAWVNSPGYVDGSANFDRPIARRCLECHATSFVSRAPPENAYQPDSLAPGLACEKCHGPGGEHVARYESRTPPASPAEAAIVNPARLTRERQLDVCALCHAGIGEPRTAPLSFVPGDVLARHLVFPPEPPSAHLDVHASQVQLLERSRCFQASGTMTCSTCHDVHRVQRDPAAMSLHCMSCHQVASCGEFARAGRAIGGRCVECHMPLEQTEKILIEGRGNRMDPSIRNHRIAIYPGPKS